MGIRLSLEQQQRRTREEEEKGLQLLDGLSFCLLACLLVCGIKLDLHSFMAYILSTDWRTTHRLTRSLFVSWLAG